MVQVDKIDTSTSAQNLAKIFKLQKTYFLDGVWGSGKTTYLDQFKDAYKNENSNVDFVELKLWEKKGNKTVVRCVFEVMHPCLGKLGFIVPFMLAISILATPQINLGLSNIIPSSLVWFGTLIALIISVYGILKPKSDDLMLHIIEKSIKRGKQIIIVDDFDRLNFNTQEEVYKLFNLLKGKSTFIFVGNYSKISKIDEEGYLPKIIDNKISLPYALQSHFVWKKYLDKLGKDLGKDLDLGLLSTLVIEDKRTLRDLDHFNNYVNQEFFMRDKLGRVQANQQLVVIYLYLFHYNDYERFLKQEEWDGTENLKHIQVFLESHRSSYPHPFGTNQKNYFLSEVASNLTKEQVKNILASDKVDSLFLQAGANESPRYKDVYDYISSLDMIKDGEVVTLKLISLAVKYFFENGSDFAKLIISKKANTFDKSDDKYADFIDETFDLSNYDVSEKIYFWVFYRFVYELMRNKQAENIRIVVQEKFKNEWNLEDFENYKKPAYFLSFYFNGVNAVTIADWDKYFKNLECDDFRVVCKCFELLEDWRSENITCWYGKKIEDEKLRQLFEKKAIECGIDIEKITPF